MTFIFYTIFKGDFIHQIIRILNEITGSTRVYVVTIGLYVIISINYDRKPCFCSYSHFYYPRYYGIGSCLFLQSENESITI